MRSFVAFVFAALVAGCSGVFVAEPIGEKPLNLKDDEDALNGTWVNPELPALDVKVEVATNGLLRVRYIEENELQEYDVYLRRGGGQTFASARQRGQTNTNDFIWFRFEKSERMVVLWMPDTLKFARLTDAGVFPGCVHNERIPRTISYSATFGAGEDVTAEKLFANAVTNDYHASDNLVVDLKNLTTNHLALIASEQQGVLFDWKNPIVFFKLSK